MREQVIFITNFIHDEQGLTIVEYAVAGALVVTALVSAFVALGTVVGDNITDVAVLLDTSDP